MNIYQQLGRMPGALWVYVLNKCEKGFRRARIHPRVEVSAGRGVRRELGFVSREGGLGASQVLRAGLICILRLKTVRPGMVL